MKDLNRALEAQGGIHNVHVTAVAPLSNIICNSSDGRRTAVPTGLHATIDERGHSLMGSNQSPKRPTERVGGGDAEATTQDIDVSRLFRLDGRVALVTGG